MMQLAAGSSEITDSQRAARNVQAVDGVQQVVRPPRRRRGLPEPGLQWVEARPLRQVSRILRSRGGEKGGLG